MPRRDAESAELHGKFRGPALATGWPDNFGFRLLALQAATALSSKTAAAPAATPLAAVPGGAGAVFGALLAKLNPKALPKSTDAAQKTETKISAGDNANAAAALQTVTPLPAQPVVALGETSAPTAPADSGKPFADLHSIDPAQLRALAQNTPVSVTKPGAPTLPVMPAPSAGDEDGDGSEEPSALSPKDIAAKDAQAPTMNSAAQTAASAAEHLLRPVTPAQTTEAQALPVRFDAKPDSQNGGANSDSGGQNSNSQSGQQSHDHSAPNTAAAPAQPVAHALTAATPEPGNSPANSNGNTNSASLSANAANAAISTTATQPAQQTTAATLHVAQATAQSVPQPDIATLAVSIAAKSLAGTKHFDIRLDPPELGHIDVHLSVDEAGNAQAHLTADKQQTLDLLQRDQGSLHSALKDSGVDLGNNGLQFSLRGQDRQGGDAPRSQPRGRALAVTAVTDTNSVSTNSLAPDSARLDIRV
jgi:flagellar hook-length control protein FliK